MPSQMEKALRTIISVFHQYAGLEGDEDKLNKRELEELVEKELSDLLVIPRDPGWVDKIMRDLDDDRDGQLSFDEFVKLVSAVLSKMLPSFSEET